MKSARNIFKKYQAQTFSFPSCLEIESAKGNYITDINGKKYLDFVAGVSGCTLGHSNPVINIAIKEQLQKHTHVMVYGEYIQSPQYKLAELLSKNLPNNLNTTYFTNSGVTFPAGSKVAFVNSVNRLVVTNTAENIQLITCFEKFKGNDLFNVKRNGLVLSLIRKI